MNLKEAFRYQNKLTEFIEECRSILSEESNVTIVKNTCFRKRVNPEAEDETTQTLPSSEFAGEITELVGFMVYLLGEKEKLFAAVRSAKGAMEFDLDSQVSLNSLRQSVGRTLQQMNDIRSSEQLITGGGTGYRFNAEGNQVSYRCDVKRVISINFDRSEVRSQLRKLFRTSEEISARIDLCLVTTQVGYEAPFDMSGTFAEAFHAYLGREE